MKIDISKMLKDYYPDGKVINLFQRDTKLYNYIRRASKDENSTISEYLKSMGLEYIKRTTGVKSEFDLENIKILINKYGFTQTKIGELLGVTRAEISRRIINNSGDANWTIQELNPQIKELLIYMIDSDLYTFESEEISVYIRSSNNEILIIIAEDLTLSFLYNIPEYIEKLLKDHSMDIYSDEEALLIKNIEFIYVMGQKKAQPSSLVRGHLRKHAKKNDESIEELVNRLGFEGIVDRKTYSDSRIVKILQKYVTRANFVALPAKAEDYQLLLTRAGRANMSIDEYIEFFGFIKEDTRLDETFQKKFNEIKRELSLLANENNEVFIDTQSNLYRKLYPFAKNRNLSVSGLVEHFGFRRIMKNEYHDDYYRDNQKTILLNEIKEIVGDMKRIHEKKEKIIRSRMLVDRLKELYDYRCQICESNNHIPLITKTDGKYYVEVHHIVPISHTFEEENIENELIDTYRNTLVLCPHHHKVIHYDNGGYNRIFTDNDEHYLLNSNGDTLKIHNNVHLD